MRTKWLRFLFHTVFPQRELEEAVEREEVANGLVPIV